MRSVSTLFSMKFVAALVLIGAIFTSSVNAAVFQADFRTAGDGLITRDTGNGLDWLDLTETHGLTVAQARTQTGVGGAFQGFRVATLDQLIGLYTNVVGPVVVSPNNNTPIFNFTSDELVRLRSFIDFFGAVNFIPNRIDIVGILEPTLGTAAPDILAGGLFFVFDDRPNGFSWFNGGYTSRGFSDRSTGVYLVREINAGLPGVPEPKNWAMLIVGFGLIGFYARRRRTGLALV